MNNVPLVFCDTETTGLSYNKQVWEVAMIRDNPDGTTERDEFMLPVRQMDTDFYEFHPQAIEISMFEKRWHPDKVISTTEAVDRITYMFRDRAQFIGMVPDFDANALWRMIRDEKADDKHGFPWYYQLIDVDNMAHGYCLAYAQLTKKYNGGSSIFSDIWKDLSAIPTDTNQFSSLIGVEKPTDDERHTAMGDAIWTRNVYYAMHEMPVPNA